LNAKGVKMNADIKRLCNCEEMPMYLAEFGGGVDKVTMLHKENYKLNHNHKRRQKLHRNRPKTGEKQFINKTYATAQIR
jgi:hypothetical protein